MRHGMDACLRAPTPIRRFARRARSWGSGIARGGQGPAPEDERANGRSISGEDIRLALHDCEPTVLASTGDHRGLRLT